MVKKSIGALFGILFLGIPFESHRIQIFRPFARSSLHKFEAFAPFSFTVPPYFEKHIHFFISDILIVLLLCLICLTMRPRVKELIFNKSSRFLTLLWGTALFSLLLSVFFRYYFQYFNLLNLAIIFLGFHLTRFFFQDQKKIIHNLLWGVALISAFECFMGCYQFFSQGPLRLFFLGEVPLHINGPHLATIPLTEKTRKLIELFCNIPENRVNLIRAYGTFIHPNVFGEYIALSLIVSYFLFTEAKTHFIKNAILVLVIIQLFSLYLSFSRAAILSWGFGTTLWFALLFSKRMLIHQKAKKQLWQLLSIICIASSFSIIILFPHFLARGGMFNLASFIQYASDANRLIYQNIALNMIKSNPLFGIGYNCFIIAPSQFFPSDPHLMKSWVHNIYLLIGSEIGLLGLGCFLLFIFSLLKPCFKNSFTPLSASLFAIFLGFLVVGLFDFHFLIVQASKLMFFLFSGVFAAQLTTKAKTLPVSSQA